MVPPSSAVAAAWSSSPPFLPTSGRASISSRSPVNTKKTYAAGKIPGGFFKREGRLRENEILTSRIIDRPLRPLFPEGYKKDTQVIATVLSSDKINQTDVMALTAASTALHVSDIPWDGPIAGIRVARVDGELVSFPTFGQTEASDIDLVVAVSKDAIVMVEGGADEATGAISSTR